MIRSEESSLTDQNSHRNSPVLDQPTTVKRRTEHPRSDPPSYPLIPLIGVVLIIFVGMTLFETLKQLINPEIGIWESHIVTIVFCTLMAAIFGHFLLQKLTRIRQKSVEEQRLRTQLQEQLTVSKALESKLCKLSTAVEQSPNSILITNVNGVIEYVNPRFTKVTGYFADEAIGNTPGILKSGETPPSTYHQLWRTIRSGNEWRGELKNRKKDGSTFWEYMSISPIRDNSGAITHFLSIQTDVSERRNMEENLRQSENRVKAILETVAEGIITLDESGVIWSFNPAAERIFGYDEDEVIGKKVDLVILPLEKVCQENQFVNWIQTLKDQPAGGGHELVGRRKDSSIFSLELAVDEFQDEDSLFFAGIVRDITERKRMEAKLREERNFIDAILTTSAAIIVVLDRQGRFVRCNRACETVTGYPFEILQGKTPWKFLLIPEEEAAFKAVFNEIKAGLFPKHFENYWLTRDGQRRLISWHNTALLDAGSKVEYIIGTGIDITERRQAEIQAREHQAQLAHMDRVSFMGEMASGLAHELNQPLTSIYAYSKACVQMLHTGQEKSRKFNEAVEKMAERAEQAGEIVRRIRGFVRKDGVKKTTVELHTIIKEAINFIVDETSEKEATIHLKLAQHNPPVLVDSVQVEQVLLNLIRNSLEAMAMSDSARRIVTIRTDSLDQLHVRVTVQDTGPGIDKRQLEHMFDTFYTTKKEGMGLGLSLCRSIIEAHGGRLWAEPTAPEGAVIQFTLPTIQKKHQVKE